MTEKTQPKALRCRACGNDWTGRSCNYGGHDQFFDATKYYPWLPQAVGQTAGREEYPALWELRPPTDASPPQDELTLTRPRPVRRTAPPGA